MKLNPDCIRDILLYVENSTDYRKPCCIGPNRLPESLTIYPVNELMYHVDQCQMSEYFSKATSDLNGNVSIKGLSPLGHQFIDNVRNDNVWNDVKIVSSKIGSKSLTALMQISSGVIRTLIEHQLGLR